MTCSWVRDNLALYVGGDLASGEEVRRLEAHLTGCGACRSEAESLRRAVAALRASAVTEDALSAQDPEYWREVEGKLRERALGIDKLRLGRGGWRSVPAVLAQAALVMVVAGALVWVVAYHGQSKPRADTPAVAKLPKSQAPVIVLVRTEDPYGNVEVSPMPAGKDVIYSDFNHFVRPSEMQRLREQVLPAAYDSPEGGF